MHLFVIVIHTLNGKGHLPVKIHGLFPAVLHHINLPAAVLSDQEQIRADAGTVRCGTFLKLLRNPDVISFFGKCHGSSSQILHSAFAIIIIDSHASP